jgi:hypothetical protein
VHNVFFLRARKNTQRAWGFSYCYDSQVGYSGNVGMLGHVGTCWVGKGEIRQHLSSSFLPRTTEMWCETGGLSWVLCWVENPGFFTLSLGNSVLVGSGVQDLSFGPLVLPTQLILGSSMTLAWQRGCRVSRGNMRIVEETARSRKAISIFGSTSYLVPFR